mmetsp:Transcript_16769/g.27167  ORF Transcript_16769/g.27167 Transcript_16769/m.27167 type:complete len:554 (-) Transcript_16769:1239-2900(-)
MFSVCCKRKPLWKINEQEQHGGELKVYDLKSLLAVGIGGTVGSGIFVLSGEISKTAAGPATVISWVIAGVVSMLTALAYAELGCLIPSGSGYNFAYVGLGEVFAVLGAWFMTLEYGVSGAAVARSWGDKVAYYASELEILGCTHASPCWLNTLGGSNINVSAAFICFLAVVVLMRGVELGRRVLNVLVFVKVGLVIFVILIGFVYFDRRNLSPFIPPHKDPTVDDPQPAIGGWHGVFLGATIAFFGYIGFDEVACLSAEAVNPKRDVPIAIVGTLLAVAALYIAASIVLVGMIPYSQIHESEGFGSAFKQVGVPIAMHIVMVGQIVVVLPAVVFVAFLPQSRLLAAVARDGLAPNAFTKIDKSGNFVFGVATSGSIMVLIALVMPFRDLNDLISGGIILSFILTNTSLIMMRLERTACNTIAVALLLVLTLTTSMLFMKSSSITGAVSCFVASLALVVFIGNRVTVNQPDQDRFRVPAVPYIPAVAILLNWCMLAQMSAKTFTQIGVFVCVAVGLYALFVFIFGYQRDGHAYIISSQVDQQECKQNDTAIELT